MFHSRIAEKTVEIPQLDVFEKIVETPEIQTGHGTQDTIQQWIVEQIADTPVLPVVEELAEASKAFSQNRVQQSSMEQTIANPAISLVEKTVTSSTQLKQRCPKSSKRHCRERSPSSMRKSTR